MWRPSTVLGKHETRLRRYQRAMSRKVKFSPTTGTRPKRRVQSHPRPNRAMPERDYLHKAHDHDQPKTHAMVCIEDLQVRNMSKSSKGQRRDTG